MPSTSEAQHGSPCPVADNENCYLYDAPLTMLQSLLSSWKTILALLCSQVERRVPVFFSLIELRIVASRLPIWRTSHSITTSVPVFVGLRYVTLRTRDTPPKCQKSFLARGATAIVVHISWMSEIAPPWALPILLPYLGVMFISKTAVTFGGPVALINVRSLVISDSSKPSTAGAFLYLSKKSCMRCFESWMLMAKDMPGRDM
jgi:hypothetical protein